MAIERIPVVICDVCGKISKIDELGQRDPVYPIPDGWREGRTDSIHICPECNAKLNKPQFEQLHFPQGVR